MKAENTSPTKAQVRELMKDWLDGTREDGRFIHRNVRAAIKRNIATGESYSGYFTENVSTVPADDFMRAARRIAQNTVDILTPRSVRVTLGDCSSFTTGEHISIATDYFDDRSLTREEIIDLLVGFCVHETAHVNHTDFEGEQEFLRTRPEWTRRLLHDICNIIEDERIEHLTGETMPGMADFLGSAKAYSFGRIDIKKNLPEEALARTLDILLLAVRFPSVLDEKTVEENFDIMTRLKAALTPYPMTPQEVYTAADRVFNEIRDLVEQQMKQEMKEQQQRLQQAGGSGNGTPGESGNPSSSYGESKEDGKKNDGKDGDRKDQNRKDETGKDKDGKNKSGKDNAGKSGKGKEGKGGEEDGPSEEEIMKQMLKETLSEEGKDAMDRMERLENSPVRKSSKDDAHILSGYGNSGDYNRMYVNGYAEKTAGPGGISYICRTKDRRNEYMKGRRRIERYIPALSKALSYKTDERDYEMVGRSGRLDTDRLALWKAGNEDIFVQEGEITCDAASVCILIDESGSMHGSNEVAARDTAILIREAVRKIPKIEFYAYGFGNCLNIYCEGRSAPPYALGGTIADGGTPTAEAMRAAAKRIRKRSSSVCLMLVLTDGYPNNVGECREADRKVRADGFLPIGIGVDGCEEVRDCFKEYKIVKDLDELAPFLAKLVKQKLMKLIRRHDSL